MSIRSVELFTGAGGLALGLEKVGCHHLAMVEFNAQACDTIRYNVANQQQLAKDWKLYQSDVRDIRYNEIAQSVDLVAGGPRVSHFLWEERQKVGWTPGICSRRLFVL